MKRAVDHIKNRTIKSYREAGRRYDVPKTLLIRRCKGLVPADGPAHKSTALLKEEETKLVEWCITREERLFGVNQNFVCETAYAIAERSGRTHPFNRKTKMAGYDRFFKFKSRHPKLSVRQPESLSAARARAMNEIVVGRYFKLLTGTISTLKLHDEPAQIYCLHLMLMNQGSLQYTDLPKYLQPK
ncbi:hypothetical protein HOLleu_08055 [Holothuria leucospilota]|uniref:HTH psq-type domain-containing protein n=1 Tax=Holothuria leucospilota TaxID=206669 RepID=A0A9Q1HG17_HOLLE|nr:hypothetical protein HOLleu_08055 [Holothuria leucospilota]